MWQEDSLQGLQNRDYSKVGEDEGLGARSHWGLGA